MRKKKNYLFISRVAPDSHLHPQGYNDNMNILRRTLIAFVLKVKASAALVQTLLVLTYPRKLLRHKSSVLEVFFELNDPALAKDYSILLFAIASDGAQLRIRANLRMLAGFTGLALQLFSQSKPKLWWPWQTPLPSQPTFTDLVSSSRKYHYNLLWPESKYPLFNPTSIYHLQVSIHPSQLLVDTQDEPVQKQHASRLARIFFSGNTHAASYSNSAMSTYYGIPSRLEIINHILSSSWSGPTPIILRSVSDLNRFMDGEFSDMLVVAQWQWSPTSSSGLDCQIPNHLWMSVLSSVDYFLACPGTRTPECHNLAESLAMGAIPIIPDCLCWRHIFSHRVNSLIYQKINDLASVFNYAMANAALPRSTATDTYHQQFSLKAISSTLLNIHRSSSCQVSFYQEKYLHYGKG